jgi:hypothetical protein
VSILGLVWCFFTPQWVEHILNRNAGKLMLALVMFIAASVIAVVTF